MKGIILAGGSGTRLHPLTIATSKQLMPVYDKPMIYYPLSTLMLAGIRDILIITNPHETAQFERLLGDGSHLGISISYAEQPTPKGLADAFIIGKDFIAGDQVALILGDNIFHGSGLGEALSRLGTINGAVILAYRVSNPSEYGVLELDSSGSVLSIEEKPISPKSNLVVPGLYFYDESACALSANLTPSDRGEIEITDLNNIYLGLGKLSVLKLERGTAWLDTGTFESLLEAGDYVRIVERRQGTKIGSPEEVAWRMKYIDDAELKILGNRLLKSGYGLYLLGLLA